MWIEVGGTLFVNEHFLPKWKVSAIYAKMLQTYMQKYCYLHSNNIYPTFAYILWSLEPFSLLPKLLINTPRIFSDWDPWEKFFFLTPQRKSEKIFFSLTGPSKKKVGNRFPTSWECLSEDFGKTAFGKAFLRGFFGLICVMSRPKVIIKVLYDNLDQTTSKSCTACSKIKSPNSFDRYKQSAVILNAVILNRMLKDHLSAEYFLTLLT